MALVLKDRVKETTTTTGTADFTLGGASTGFQSFSVIGNGNTTYYAAVDPTTGDWEVGVGTYSTTGPTLTRDSVLESSNAGSKVVFAAGSKDVFCTYPAERSVNLDAAGSAVTILDIGTLGVSTANISTANITSGTVSTTPTSSTDIANKTYVDTQVSSGITYHSPVKYEVPNTTGNLTANYNQPGGPGVGVGATLTNAGTLAAFAPDGPTAQVGDRILVYNQTNAFENGVYTVTTVGSGAVAWVLTRATDADTYALKSPNGLGLGDAFFVTSGNTGAGETYVCNTSGTITFGTTNITFVQISSAQVYSAGTGLNLSPATTFNISNTGVTASTYGSGSNVPVFAVNAQGQITSVTNTAIAISAGAVSGLAASATTDTTDATNITSGTLPSGRLNGSYTGVTGVGTLTAGTWNGSTIAAAYGGTGLSSYAVGDLIYADTTTSLAKLADVASGNVLLSGGVGTAPAWGQVGLQTHVTGTLQVTNGGTGATTLTGYVKGNGTSAFTASASIPNSDTTATSANTANTIVARDSSGNFSAGTITANLSGNATTATSATSATTATQVANSLTFATSGTGLSGSGSFNGSSAQTFTVTSNATSANTASTIVARDASGDFSAGTITASLSGNASTATSTGTVAASTSNGIQSAYQAAINTTTPGWGLYGIHFNGQTTADYAVGITSNGGSVSTTAAQAGIYIQGSGAYGTKMYLATTDSYAIGSKTAVSIDHLGVVQTTRNYFQAAGSARAPIFYDSDNTAYYGDFANTGTALNTAGTANFGNGGTDTGVGIYYGSGVNDYGRIRFYQAGTNNQTIHVFPTTWQSGTLTSASSGAINITGANGVTLGPWNAITSVGHWFDNLGNGQSSISFRSAIFYDSNDTAYYVNPNTSTSANFYGSVNAATYNLAGLRVNASGTSSAGGAIAIQQVTSEGWTGIFCDFEPYTGWGLWHDNPNNYFLITAEDSTNNIGSNTVPSRSSGNRTAYTKFLFNQTYGEGIAGGSWRAPIFYDSNNTAYYIDPNSTSISASFAGSAGLGTNNPINTAWGSSSDTKQLFLYANNYSVINLRADAIANSYYSIGTGNNRLYAAYDNNAGVHRLVFYGDYTGFNNVTTPAYNIHLNGTGYASADWRAPIFYDSDNTGYYCNPNSVSYLYEVQAVNWFRVHGETGLYSQSYGQHFYPDSGGYYWESDGPIRIRDGYEGAIQGYIGYHDGNGFGLLSNAGEWWLNTPNNGAYLVIGGSQGYNPYASVTGRKLMFGGGDSDAINNYYIGTNIENYNGNYNKLDFRWHTGIRIGASVSYGGIRFYQDQSLGTLLWQFNGTSNYSYQYIWNNLTGYHGIYSGYNSAHFYPNDGTYGAWKISGARNGWTGIEFSNGGSVLMMNTDSYGFYYIGVGWRFYVSGGSGYFPGNVTAYWSDKRLKENITSLEKGEGINTVLKLIPSRFNWKKGSEKVTLGTTDHSKIEVSLIAQEAQEVNKDFVTVNATAKKGIKIDGELVENVLTINYDKITPYIIQAIKDILFEIDVLKTAIKELQNGSN